MNVAPSVNLGVRAKRVLFAHYWWAALLLLGILIATWQCELYKVDWQTFATLIGGLFTGVFLIQKQKVEELSLFRGLFVQFNATYDKLNNALQAIARSRALRRPEDEQTIVDYFNLCAEEYWWYRAGYVPDSVWSSWCRGMKTYLVGEPFTSLWESEVKSNSYYGLSLEHIEAGAKLDGRV